MVASKMLVLHMEGEDVSKSGQVQTSAFEWQNTSDIIKGNTESPL